MGKKGNFGTEEEKFQTTRVETLEPTSARCHGFRSQIYPKKVNLETYRPAKETATTCPRLSSRDWPIETSQSSCKITLDHKQRCSNY